MKITPSLRGVGGRFLATSSSFLQRRKKFAVAIAAIVLALLLVIIFTRGGTQVGEFENRNRTVETASVAALSSQTAPLPALGVVRSESEATLRFERAGEVSGVYTEAGRFVPAGTILAELKNASERAAVAQAHASVAQAEANLAKVQKGSRDEQLSILEINKANAEVALQNSKESAVNTLLSSYNTVRDAILQKADQTFSNPRSGNPTFNLPTSDFELANSLPSKRVAIEVVITSEETRAISISTNSNVELELTRTLTDLRDIVVEASISRLRPIMLTTLTTVIGIIPLIFAAELWAPLAFSVIFGLSFSVIITLLLIPMLYLRKPGDVE